MRILITFLCFVFYLCPDISYGQNISNDNPIEITADEAIEWLRDDHIYQARGNAMAKKGNIQISADTLQAFHDPDDSSKITEIHANNNVVITRDKEKATSDKAVYNIFDETVILTGSNLTIRSPDGAVTAQKQIEYNLKNRIAKAQGNAQASDGTNTITADVLSAFFGTNNQQETTLNKVTAQGHVRIETPTDIIKADKASYNLILEEANAQGHVILMRDNNQLSGNRAIVNLKTGVSQLLSEPDNDQTRVRALFYPNENGKSFEIK